MVDINTGNNGREIEYPFHGFYRSLLSDETEGAEEQTAAQTEETDSAAAQTPIENPADDAAQNTAQWIADVIGDDYKTWNTEKIAIEATTGTGKTTFVIKTLISYARDETMRTHHIQRILILCNRTALKADILTKYKETYGANVIRYDWGEEECIEDEIVTIATYQWYEKKLKNARNKEQVLSGYKIIVLDECHYFFDDAGFNENTTVLYQAIQEREENALTVWMTATPGDMYNSWKRQGKLMQENHYKLIRKAEHIIKALIYYKDAELIDIINRAMERGEKTLVMVTRRDKLEEMRKQYGSTAAYYCSANNKYGAMDALEDCVLDGKLQKPILFATEALYNGVDIKDETLKHIVIESWVPLKIIQMQGRKRPINADDTCTVYYRALTANQTAVFMRHEKSKLEPVEAYLKKQKGDSTAWEELLQRDDAKQLVNDCPAMEFNPVTCEYDINRMMAANMMYRRDVLELIKQKGYAQAMYELVWNELLEVEPEYYVIEGVEKYINEHIGVRMQKEELREGLLNAGLCKRTTRSLGPKKLNMELAKYHVQIQTERKSKREGEAIKKTPAYWYLKEM